MDLQVALQRRQWGRRAMLHRQAEFAGAVIDPLRTLALEIDLHSSNATLASLHYGERRCGAVVKRLLLPFTDDLPMGYRQSAVQAGRAHSVGSETSHQPAGV